MLNDKQKSWLDKHIDCISSQVKRKQYTMTEEEWGKVVDYGMKVIADSRNNVDVKNAIYDLFADLENKAREKGNGKRGTS